MPTADAAGVNVYESEREQSRIIRRQFCGARPVGAIFRGAQKKKMLQALLSLHRYLPRSHQLLRRARLQHLDLASLQGDHRHCEAIGRPSLRAGGIFAALAWTGHATTRRPRMRSFRRLAGLLARRCFQRPRDLLAMGSQDEPAAVGSPRAADERDQHALLSRVSARDRLARAARRSWRGM